jgi:hypothetical protein
VEATEPTEDLRKPPNVTESRFDFRVGAPGVVTVGWRGTREEGDPRTDCRWLAVILDVDLSPFSMTPNSLMDDSPGMGEGSVVR